MQDIQDLREEMQVGSYWIVTDGPILKLRDVPTDGPLFVDLEEDNPEFELVQMSVDEFHDTQIQEVEMDQEPGEISFSWFASGTDVEYKFSRHSGRAWPEWMIQGGESYRVGLEEIPDWLELVIEDAYGLELEER